MHNPWNINSLYDLQFFNCPSCIFKNQSKQDFVNHAYEIHPESIEYLKKLNDKSISDIEFPLDKHISEIKIEENFIIISFDNDSNDKDIAIENEKIREIQKNDSFCEIEAEESIKWAFGNGGPCIIDNQCNEESNQDFDDPLHIEKNNSNLQGPPWQTETTEITPSCDPKNNKRKRRSHFQKLTDSKPKRKKSIKRTKNDVLFTENQEIVSKMTAPKSTNKSSSRKKPVCHSPYTIEDGKWDGTKYYICEDFLFTISRTSKKTGQIWLRCKDHRKLKCPVTGTIEPGSSLVGLFNQNHNHTIEESNKAKIFTRRDCLKAAEDPKLNNKLSDAYYEIIR